MPHLSRTNCSNTKTGLHWSPLPLSLCVCAGAPEGPHVTGRNTEARGESQIPQGDPGSQHRPSRRWGDNDSYPVLVVDDLHQAAMLRLDGRRRHGLLGLRRLGGLLLQLLLWEGEVVSAGRRKEGRPRAAWVGGRAQEVRLLTISSESPSGTPSPGEAPAPPAGKSPAQGQLQPLQPAFPGSIPPWELGS